jgi:tRNA(Ile)-lysidine synthase
MLSIEWLRNNHSSISQDQKNIYVAYSGGVDSHVLLHLVASCFKGVRAIHINHGLSPNADKWQQHCEQVCANLEVPLTCIKVNAQPIAKQSPEDAARIARRTAWQQTLTADDLLLLAHHADDQTETILYRLFRGAGPKGLSGMQQKSKIGSLQLFRPLLTVSKQQILQYAHQTALMWITDESNSNSEYDRNYIRNQIMPLVSERWAAASCNINRAGKLCEQLRQCLDPELQNKLQATYGDNANELDLKKLTALSSVWITEILRAWLQAYGVTPTSKQIFLINQQVIGARIDANPILVIDTLTIRRSNNKLYLLPFHDFTNCHKFANNEKSVVSRFVAFEKKWDLQQAVALPDGTMLSPDAVTSSSAVIDKLSQYEVIIKIGTIGQKAKKIFQEHAIPPWERQNYPIIYADGRLVAIAGLWLSPRFCA